MSSYISISGKRKCTYASQSKSSKRKCFELQLNITELSDCTLLHILQFLDATALYQLGQTCSRFKQLVQDESLWIYVNGRSRPNNVDKANFCWQNVTSKTKHIKMGGSQRSRVLFSLEALIHSNKLTNLTVLALEHQCIKYCKLKDFPTSLQELSFRHSYIPDDVKFFRFGQESMKNLKTLLLDHCQWLEAGSVMAICRFPELEILSLYMCKRLCDDDISCISIAGKFGFKKLKVIDLRFTSLGDLFLKVFYRSPSLQIVYFQCFPTTYRVERFKRKLDIITGAKIREDGYVSDDEVNNDSSKDSFRKVFGAEDLIASDAQTITDDTLIVFNRLKSSGQHNARPKSFLYVYPYDKCTCGFFDKKSERSEQALDELDDDDCDYVSNSDSSDDEKDEWNRKTLQCKLAVEVKKQKQDVHFTQKGKVFFMHPDKPPLCRKLVYNSCVLPAWCRVQSNSVTCEQSWLYLREPRNDYEISMLEHTDKHFKVRDSGSCRSYVTTDCGCGDSCNRLNDNVIVIRRGSDGTLIHSVPHDTPPRTTQFDIIDAKKLSDEELKYLIEKVSESINSIRESSEVKTAVNEVLVAFKNCLKKDDFLTLAEDETFVTCLGHIFALMLKCIRYDLESVLAYHSECFQELAKLLDKEDNLSQRKMLLKLFFENLRCSESDENSTSYVKEDNSDRTQYSNFEEVCNLPGPSGLQHGKKRKRMLMNGNKKTLSDAGVTTSDTTGDLKRNTQYKLGVNIRFLHPQNHPHFAANFNIDIVSPQSARTVPTNIKELSLRGYRVSDTTLDVLKELELDLLDVTGTAVTATAVQSFMLSNPHCRLIHESACVCRPKLHF